MAQREPGDDAAGAAGRRSASARRRSTAAAESVGAGRRRARPRRRARSKDAPPVSSCSQQVSEPGGAPCPRRRCRPRARRPPWSTARAARRDVLEHLDEEHRRAIHEHQVAGLADAGAERLGPRVDGAGAHRRALGSRVAVAACAVTRPTTSLAARRAGVRAGRSHDVRRPGLVPVRGVHVVERAALAGRVVVEDVLARQSLHQERVASCTNRRRADQTSGSWRRTQRSFGADGLAAERGPAPGEDRVRAVAARSAPRSRRRPACRSRRGSPAARGRSASSHSSRHGPTPLSAERGDPALAGPGGELPTQRHQVLPPDPARRRPPPSPGGAWIPSVGGAGWRWPGYGRRRSSAPPCCCRCRCPRRAGRLSCAFFSQRFCGLTPEVAEP